MLKEVKLESIKYLEESVNQQYSEFRREKNRGAIRSFVLFLSVLACFFIGMTFVDQVPYWLYIMGINH